MGITQIVIVVFVLLVLLYLIIKAFSKTNNLTKMGDGKVLQTIKANSLKNTNNSSNFTYSMWIFIDDWNYMFGNKKTVLSRNGGPDVILGDKPNTLQVKIAYYATGDDATAPTGTINTSNCAANAANATACQACNNGFTCACANCDPALYAATYNADGTPRALNPPCDEGAGAGTGGNGTTQTTSSCLIENIPIQKWVNVIISLYGSTLDTYLDGKLVRTCVLPGVPKIDNSADILVSPYGGFSGWTTTFKFWAYASNPQEAYNIYKDGFGGSILGNLFNKYRARFSIVHNNKVTGSFEI
jgi:hypothetical protein